MRVFSRLALVLFLSLVSHAAFAQRTAECPLSLVSANTPTTGFGFSPHAVFRSGSTVFELRGQTLTTFNVTELGDMQIAREDFVGSLVARDPNSGVAFSKGFLYVSSAAGLEIFDLRNVRAGGNEPILVSRTPGLNFQRLAVSGNTLVGINPATGLPCTPTGSSDCANSLNFINISNPASPVLARAISSVGSNFGFNDVAVVNGTLFVTGVTGTLAFNISNPSLPQLIGSVAFPGTFISTNAATTDNPRQSVVVIGSDTQLALLRPATATGGANLPLSVQAFFPLPNLTIGRSNPIAFHPQVAIDDGGGHLITLIDEIDPERLVPARTIAFDVFDLNVPSVNGSDPRNNETVTLISPDEIKFDPLAVGPFVYVTGSQSGLQTYGACGQFAGRFELDSAPQLTCGGSEIHGSVTGATKIFNVEIFLDGTSLGSATLSDLPRSGSFSRTPVLTFGLPVNLDSTARGDHLLRAVATDATGNQRQFASQRLFFAGPGQNCTNRRRASGKR